MQIQELKTLARELFDQSNATKGGVLSIELPFVEALCTSMFFAGYIQAQKETEVDKENI